MEEKLEGASDYTVKSRNVYNGEGQRIRQYNEAGEYERYFYMGGALAFTTGSSTDYVPSENILGPDGRIIASKRGFKEIYENPTESAYQFYHYDMQASVGSIVLGEEGAAGYRYTERNQYDPFGKQNESTSFSEVENNIKYGGSMSDSSGLYYMGARHYDPNVGRFLQQDSYKGDRYSPWTQNLYTYTSNNPVNYIDPTGHFWEEIFGDIGTLFGWILGGSTSATTGGKVGSGLGNIVDKVVQNQKERNKKQLDTTADAIGAIGVGTTANSAVVAAAPIIHQLTFSEEKPSEYAASNIQVNINGSNYYLVSRALKGLDDSNVDPYKFSIQQQEIISQLDQLVAQGVITSYAIEGFVHTHTNQLKSLGEGSASRLVLHNIIYL